MGYLLVCLCPKASARRMAVFLSGNRAPTEFRDGNAGHSYGFRMIRMSLIRGMFSCRCHWPLWCKTNNDGRLP